jgi:opacity protein-like surface antigen
MKRLFAVATMLAALSLPALAAKNSETVSIPSPVKAGSTELTPGDYNVTWTGTGSDVQVTVTKNKKVITTFPAKLVQENNKNVGLETDSKGGTDVLHAIRMRNSTLIVGTAPSSGQ